MHKSFNVIASPSYPLGVRFVPEGLHISAVCRENTEFGIVLYDNNNKNGVKIPFPKEYRKGMVYSMLLKGYKCRNCSYLFYQGEKLIQDPYAIALDNDRKYGEVRETPSRCKVYEHAYDWQGDTPLRYPFEDSIFYMMHVRGFTRHKSSKVKYKGTYAGIAEKIPYLKELGITAVLLMPSYEFDEVFKEDNPPINAEWTAAKYNASDSLNDAVGTPHENRSVRVNYWGYQEGLYFMPKYAYSHSRDAVMEFKDMVKTLHRNGIEVMMQFYFPPSVNCIQITEILKHWVLEYHIDGFHLKGIDIPMRILRNEPLFAETKLIGEKDDYPICRMETGRTGKDSGYKNFAFINDAFLYDMRKLLKGDANMIDSFMNLCRLNYTDKGVVNYIAGYKGFCLYDLVSYNNKHNESNGENNNDGITQNYSWNCGVEGKSRKKAILELRLRQMKNAMSFVMLSQGTPLIYSGDEFANSQEGNNNPYCQDNPVCWLQWHRLKTNRELFDYVKELISLRRTNSILHAKSPLMGTDYISCGYPDISFHGKDAWIPYTEAESRSLGIMYCGQYGADKEKADNRMIYMAVNMHWEPYCFGLPQISKDLEWKRLLTTYIGSPDKKCRYDDVNVDITDEQYNKISVYPRSIEIYVAKEVMSGKKSRTKGNKKQKGAEIKRAIDG